MNDVEYIYEVTLWKNGHIMDAYRRRSDGGEFMEYIPGEGWVQSDEAADVFNGDADFNTYSRPESDVLEAIKRWEENYKKIHE
ncbi:MAG: hypothetical protein IJM76_05875 [Lachnospiraceae bacterium]|nr:hypothetical protein [Lachnospiraceae bacterium]